MVVVKFLYILAFILLKTKLFVVSKPVLHFLFLEEKRFLNAHIWSQYFENGEGKVKVFIHSNHEKFTIPEMQFPVEHIPSNVDQGQEERFEILNTMINMLSVSLDSSSSPAMGDIFIFLSSDAIPTKPLDKVYDWYTETVPSLGTVPHSFSSFCLSPTREWVHNDKEIFKRVARHQPWVSLNRTDSTQLAALAKVENFANTIQKAMGNYSQVFELSSKDRVKRSVADYWFYFAVVGTVDLNDPSSWRNMQPVFEVEQGTCHMFDLEDRHTNLHIPLLPYSPFFTNNSVGHGAVHKHGMILNPHYSFLEELVNSPSIFFARSFRADDPSSHVVQGLWIDHDHHHGNTGKNTFRHVLEELKVLPASDKSHGNHADDGLNTQEGVYSDDEHPAELVYTEHNLPIADDGVKETAPTTHIEEKNTGIRVAPTIGTGKGDNTGLKVLLVSVDDRPIHRVLDNEDYVSMCQVLQHDYAMHNGYDYLAIRASTDQLIQGLKDRHPEEMEKVEAAHVESSSKYGFASYHPGLKYFRASSWSKLPPLWNITATYGHLYDYVWFIDSDATPNPAHQNRSVGDAVRFWTQHSTDKVFNDEVMVYKGNPDPSNATFLFLSNFPWRADMPCAGTFLFKPNELAERIFREWWDYDIPQKNQWDFMEQDALWYMLEESLKDGNPYHFLMDEKAVSLLSEPQFPSNYQGPGSNWLLHVPNYEAYRNKYIRTMLIMTKGQKQKPENFAAAVDLIVKDHHWEVSMLELAETMQATRTGEVRSDYPHVREGREDDWWHGITGKPAAPDIPPGYDGYMLGFHGHREIYLVVNGTKRAFPNLQTLDKMGYDLDLVLSFNPSKSTHYNIPQGPDLPEL